MKLKGIKLKGTYKVKFYDDYFEVCNDKGEPFYYEDQDGYLSVKEYDEINNQLYYGNSSEGVVNEKTKTHSIDLRLAVLYDDVVDLKNRLSADGSKEIYEEDYLLLDRLSELLEEHLPYKL